MAIPTPRASPLWQPMVKILPGNLCQGHMVLTGPYTITDDWNQTERPKYQGG
jgi:hypothetical protein